MTPDLPSSAVGQVKAIYFHASKMQQAQIRAWFREIAKVGKTLRAIKRSELPHRSMTSVKIR